jgi:hypothetical protein
MSGWVPQGLEDLEAGVLAVEGDGGGQQVDELNGIGSVRLASQFGSRWSVGR